MKVYTNTQAKLNELKKHIEDLKEIDALKEEYNLNHKITKYNPYVSCSCKIKQNDFKNLLKICSKNKKTQSKFIRDLILKELEGFLK